jgi:hypothetical protein
MVEKTFHLKHLIQNINFLCSPFSAQFCLMDYHKITMMSQNPNFYVFGHILMF